MVRVQAAYDLLQTIREMPEPLQGTSAAAPLQLLARHDRLPT